MKAKKIALIVAGLILLITCSAVAGTITHEYDELNRLIRTIHPDGTVIEYTYDEAGNRLTVIKGNTVGEVPTVQISANPTSIDYGASSTLTWSSTNATSCDILPDVGVGLAPSGTATVSPLETTTYVITATGGGVSVSNSVTVTVGPPPLPTVSLSADPMSIDYGASSTLSWSATNATSCTIDHGVGPVNPPEGGTVPVSPLETTTYTITAEGPGGTITATVTVTVIPPPAPTVLITADSMSIDYGDSSTLSWSSTNAVSCAIQPEVGTGNPLPPVGTATVSPLETTTYTITATNLAGATATAEVTVTVLPPPAPTVQLSADPTSIDYGASSTLTWSATNAVSCTIDHGVGEVTPPTGGAVTVSPLETTTYTITATNLAGATATAEVTVTVAPPSAPTVSLSADPTTIQYRAFSTLSWTSANAASCTIDQGIGSVNTSGSATVSPSTTTTYTITATGLGGTSTNAVTVTVLGCDLTLHDETITAENNVEHTTECAITAGPNYIIEPNATVTLLAGQDITLTPGFEARDGCEFRAGYTDVPPAAPTVQITANPASIDYGASSILTWSSTHAASCTIDQGIGSVNTSGSIAISPVSTTTYTITALGTGGSVTGSVTITVTPPPPPPTVQISAEPMNIDYGASSTLAWSSTNATSCEIQPDVGGNLDPNGTTTVTPISTTTYTITATGAGGTTIKTVTVTVAPPPSPTVQISADPMSIDYGTSSTLAWSSTNATSCEIQPDVGGGLDPNGTLPVSPIATTIYTITATGPGGMVTSTVTVTVVPPPAPTVQISADPMSIDYGASSTLTWSSTNAVSCTIDHGVGPVNPPEGGTRTVSPLETTTYTITATNLAGDTATATVTVTVIPPPAPTVSISADPTSIQEGGSATLTWISTNADSCTIDQGVGSVAINGTTTVSPTSNTTYTITATGTGGTATSNVTVTVLSCDITLHDETITAGSTIEQTTACTITAGPNYIIEPNATVTFKAGEEIILNPGFEARNGCEFRAMKTP
jgi:YD repeat-containing protein